MDKAKYEKWLEIQRLIAELNDSSDIMEKIHKEWEPLIKEVMALIEKEKAK